MDTMKQFCPNCGQEITAADDFCPNCGFNLKEFRANQEVPTPEETPVAPVEETTPTPEPEFSEPTPEVEPTTPPEDVVIKQAPIAPTPTRSRSDVQPKAEKAPKKPGKKNKKWLIPVIALVVLIAGFFGIGSYVYGQDRQAGKIADTLLSGNTEEMAKVVLDEEGNELTAAELKPFSELIRKDASTDKAIKQVFKDGHAVSGLALVESGKKLGFFKQYKAQLASSEVIVDTNIEDPKFELDGQRVKAEDSSVIKVAVFGEHKITVSNDEETKTKTVKVKPGEDSISVTINTKTKEKISDIDDEDDDEDYDSEDEDYDTEDDEDEDTDSDSNSIVGTWVGDTSTVVFHSDGTYELEGKHGTYTIDSRSGDQMTMTYKENNDPAKAWTTHYTIRDGVLTWNRTGDTWDKQ